MRAPFPPLHQSFFERREVNVSRMIRSVLVILLVSCGWGCATAGGPGLTNYAPISPEASPAEVIELAATITPSERQLAWQELEMTAFLHFGVNTFTDREWGDGREDPAVFNPTELDTRQWMRVLRDAGMKLVILTAKHHDGFALWPTETTEHSVRNSPWRNGQGDVVREAAEAAREYGLRFGVYLSPWDRNAESYGDSPRYNQFFLDQLRELLTWYGPIDEVWFDGAKGDDVDQEYDWAAYYSLARELQPEAVIAVRGPDVRWVGTETGYGRETEWSVVGTELPDPELAAAGILMPPLEPQDADLGSRAKLAEAEALFWYPSEVDVSIRPGWFYHASQDHQVKSLAKLVDIYYSSIGRNSVLLLNVPPDPRGLIHEVDADHLMQLRRFVDATFAENLAVGARVEASSAARKHPAEHVLDDDAQRYWLAAEGDTSAVLTFQFEQPITFNTLRLQEQIRVGQRIERFVLEGWNGADWEPITEGTTVGYKRLLRFPAVETDRVRLRIDSSRLNPTLSAFGLHLAPEVLDDPVIARGRDGVVRIVTESPDPVIVYTLDGSEPTPASPRYTEPFPLPQGGVVRARAFINEMSEGSAIVERQFDIAKTTWRVVSASNEPRGLEAARAIDERAATMWHTTWQNNERPHPHEIVIDFGETLTLQGFTYLPRQDGNVSGTVDRYSLFISDDGENWGEPAAQGAFENVMNNPIEQAVRFATPVQGRYMRFVAHSSVIEGETWTSVAELGVITR